MIASHFALIDALLVVVALAAVLLVGWRLRGRMQSASDFLFGSDALPSWVAGIGMIAANVGLPEVIGMGAAGAMYGFSAAHFYWLGAVPALVFLALFMIPVYRSAGARSVPEYLGFRFDSQSRTLAAVAFAVAAVVMGGVALHVAGTVLQLLLGWPFGAGVALAVTVATACVLAGGLSATIYAAVLQFALLVFGLAPLLLIGFAATDGWPMLQHRLSQAAINSQLPPAIYTHVWKGMGHPLTNAFGITHVALLAGLGGALAMGTWCGDVRVMQRAMRATGPGAARRAPLIAAIPALFLPALLMIPGMLARMLGGGEAGRPFGGMAQGLIPARRAADGTAMLDPVGHSLLDFGIATPKLLATLYPAGMLGLGVAALLAACTAGFAAHLTTFNTMLGWDLRRAREGVEVDDLTRLRRARLATLLGAALAIVGAYAVRAYAASPRGMRATGGGAYVVGGVGSLVDIITLLLAVVNVPVFVVLVLGMSWRRITARGALAGLASGMLAALVHHAFSLSRSEIPGLAGGFVAVVFPYYTPLAQRLWTAIVAMVAAAVVAVAVSLFTTRRPEGELDRLVFSRRALVGDDGGPWWRRPATIGAGVILVMLLLTLRFS